MTTIPLVDLSIHHKPEGLSDQIALAFTKVLRFSADTFFAKRYGHRAIVLETVAAVPGMVGATLTHLRCLRRMCDDKGWIRTLMEEAENERMHLMTFIEVAKPTMFERLVILAVQWGVLSRLLHLVPAERKDGTPGGGIFRGRGSDQLHAVSRRAGRRPLSERAGARDSVPLLETGRRRDLARRRARSPGRRSAPS